MNYTQIPGWCDFDDVYQMAVDTYQEGIFVEIGSWLGRSAASMADKIKKSGKNITFYCIDTFEGSVSEESHQKFTKEQGGSLNYLFIKNLYECGLHDKVKIIQENSAKAHKLFEDKSLSFVFIDGDHPYESVKTDILNWKPKVKVGGILAGHDYTPAWPGVKKAVDEFFPNVKIMGKSWILHSHKKSCGFLF